MKKFALIGILLAGILFAGMSQVSAQEVYAVTEKHAGKINDYYVVTESIQNNGNAFGLTVHIVGQNHSYNKYSNWFYAKIRGKWHFVPGGQLAAAIEMDRIDPPMLRSVIYGIFNTARKYM